MSAGFPCPNPSCLHVFAPDAVSGAATIVCPRCGNSYRFRSSSPKSDAAQRVAPPPPPKVVPPPPPKVVPPPVPPSVAVTPAVLPPSIEEGELAFPTQPALVVSPRRRRQPKSWGWLRALLVLLVVAGSAVGVLYYFRHELNELLYADSAQRQLFQTKGNFSFTPAPGWKRDQALIDKSRANLAMSLAKPRSHMMLFYLDHPTREFSDAQLLDRSLRHLQNYFLQIEYEDPFQGEKNGRTDTLGGEPAIVYPFSAIEADEVPMRGLAYILTRRGYTYWLYCWGPEDYFDDLSESWSQLRQGFQLFNDREGWKPPPREMETGVGTALAYQLRYAKDIWRTEGSPLEADEKCDFFLRGYEAIEDQQTGQKKVTDLAGLSAEFMVLALPRAADLKTATTTAFEYVKKRLAETNPSVKLEKLPPRSSKPGPEVGLFRGQVDRYRVELGSSNERYLLLAVVNRSDGLLAIVCESRWDRRDYWELEFRAIVDSLRPAAKSETPPTPKEPPPEKLPEEKPENS